MLIAYSLIVLLYQVSRFESTHHIKRFINPLNDAFINYINSLNTTWRAGRNFHPSIDYNFLKAIGNGYDPRWDESVKSIIVANVSSNLPDEFDSRVRWPNCPTIREIRDQGSCGSCWAFGAVEAMSDRVCIHSNQKVNFHFSAENLLTCCETCGNGCYGASHRLAWKYWVENGIVSGGSYKSHEGCQPYHFPSCNHHEIGPKPNCTNYEPTPKCALSCQHNYNVPYKSDLRFGKIWYSLDSDQEVIKTEIFNNGPVEASMSVYEDFYFYKSGVYQHVMGELVGMHAMKIIGWGIDKSVNTPYWLISNSFNKDWGDHGYVKLKRGVNECQIENDVTAGIPLL